MAHGQGEGEPPDRSRDRVDWLIKEVGVSEDGMTIRESIEATDAMLYAAIRQMATEEDVAALREEIERLTAAPNRPTDEDIANVVDQHLSKKDVTTPPKTDDKLGFVSTEMFWWAIGLFSTVLVAITTTFASILFRHGVSIGTLSNKIEDNNSTT